MPLHTAWQRAVKWMRSTARREMRELQSMRYANPSALWNLIRSQHLQKKRRSTLSL